MKRASWILLLGLLGGIGGAQSSRVVGHLDGSPLEAVQTEGKIAFLHAPGTFVEGTGALEIAPAKDQDYYGCTLRNLAGQSPKELRFQVFLDSERPATYVIKIDDDTTKGQKEDAGYLDRALPPRTWSEVVIDLEGLKTRSKSRTLDFKTGVRSIRFSKRRADGDAAFRIDAVCFTGEPASPESAKAVQSALSIDKGTTGDARARTLREALPRLPQAERLKHAAFGLDRESNERVRRACREALASLSEDAAVAAFIASLPKRKSETRLEHLWALGSMPSEKARSEALGLAAHPKTPSNERTALLQGLLLRGASDYDIVADACPAGGPWPERAALVRALFEAGTKESVDLLIRLLERPGHVRVLEDVVDALVRLTGNDLGANASSWREWWKVFRENADLRQRDRSQATGYAAGAFFGIPLSGGRLAFLLDVSGSMRDPVKGGKAEQHLNAAPYLKDAKIATRLDLARLELKHAIEALPKDAAAGVITFNDEALWVSKGIEKLETTARRELCDRLDGLSASHKTNIHDAIFQAFHAGKKTGGRGVDDGPDTIYLLSDGAPSAGPISNGAELRDAVLRWNLGRMIRIHVINVGDSADRTPLAALPRASGGVFDDLSSNPAKEKDDQGGKLP